MSVRAVIIAVLGAVFIAAVGYFNDQVARLNHFVGNFLPIIVFFPLIVAAAALNPMLRAVRSRWRFSAGETAVIVALLLVACNIPGSGLLRMFSRNLVMPIQANRTRPGWNKVRALSYAPPYMLANNGQYDDSFIRGLMWGEGRKDAPIGFRDVPWSRWARPLTIWMPLVVLFAVASICLSLMVHRAWSQRERLPYPLAQLAGSLMGGGQDRQGRSIFRSRNFLVAACLIFAIHLVNGTYAWSLGRSINIPMLFHFGEFMAKFPVIRQVPWGAAVCQVRIWPSMIALACLVASDVSFSLGVAPLVWLFVGYWLIQANVRLEGFTLEGGLVPWQSAGSSIAMGLVLIYLGRRFYLLLLRGALGLGVSPEVKSYEVWACRFFLLSLAALTAILTAIGLTWPVAASVVLLFMLAYLVFARISAESGLFLVQTQWRPMVILLGVLGAEALGLRTIAIVGMLTVVFGLDRRECLMPLFVNGLRACDLGGARTASVGKAAVVVFLIALAVAVPFSLWVDHNYGLQGGEWWSTKSAPVQPFDHVAKKHAELSESGHLDQPGEPATLQRLAAMKSDPRALIAMVAGAAAALILYRLRLRYTWWPLHPIMLVVWCTWGMLMFSYSFLIGWAIKKLTSRFGISHTKLRTFMIGVIVGELSGGALWMIVGAIYWIATGQTPPRYLVFPGG